MTRPLIPTIWNTEYACAACSYRAPVQFVDPDSFPEDEPVGGRDKWSQQAALQEAQARLEKRGRRAMQLVRCPSCQRRDEAAVRRSYRSAALPLIGVAPAAFMISIIIGVQLWPARSSMRLPGLAATLMTLLVSALVVLRGQRQLLAEATAALHFDKKG